MSSLIYETVLILRPQNYKNCCSTNFVGIVPKKELCGQMCPI